MLSRNGRKSVVGFMGRIVGRVGLDRRSPGYRGAADMSAKGKAVFDHPFDDEVELVLVNALPPFRTTCCVVSRIGQLHLGARCRAALMKQ